VEHFSGSFLEGLLMDITREIFWNVGSWVRWPAYALGLIAVLIFAFGLRKLIRHWRAGKPESRLDSLPDRIRSLLSFGFFHRRLLREPGPGVSHLMLFWGFIFLFIGTCLVLIQEDITVPLFDVVFLKGTFYLVFSFILDFFGLAAIVGVILFAVRRYVLKPDRLDSKPEDLIALVLFMLILITGFLNEGIRIAVTRPDFERYSFMGWWISGFFHSPAASEASLRSLHAIFWWVHMLLAFTFIGLLTYSKFLHIVTSAANLFFRSFGARGEVKPIEDIEEQEIFGVERFSGFTWKQLLDLDACTRCGRCQDNCPAFISEKPLSPKKVIQDLRAEMHLTGFDDEQSAGTGDGAEREVTPLAGTTVTEDELWACTTCGACHEACPVFIEVIDKVVDLRRYLVLMESRFPQEVTLFFRNMETNFNPWGLSPDSRADWVQDLPVEILAEKRDAEYLLWVGCSGSFDDRNIKVTRSLASLLNKAGISYAILGREEMCCGETARRMGNEYLAQILMQQNMELFSGYGVKKIITPCPHCFNSFKNEYHQFEGSFEVYHHAEFLHQLAGSGRLNCSNSLDMKAVYHDSCYLGRHNNIYDPPRELLALSGVAGSTEMKRNRDFSFCCGAGGGRMWMEETIGTKINHVRVEEAIATDASVITTACPYCLIMMWDGVKDKGLEDRLQVLDLAEIVEKAL
jgi:Fe-S oxidoreductase/nitrate reductase gamma subunit